MKITFENFIKKMEDAIRNSLLKVFYPFIPDIGEARVENTNNLNPFAPTMQKPSTYLVMITVIGAALVFAFDLMLPLGIAGSVPYVAVVFIGWWYPNKYYIFILAVITTALTVTGYFFSEPGGTHWVVVANRLLSLFAIWVAAFFLFLARMAIGEANINQARLIEAIHSLHEGFVLYDADDCLVMANNAYREINPQANAHIEQGLKFEDLVRANIEKNWIVDARGCEDEFLRKRMELHRNPKGPFTRQFGDNKRYMVNEIRTREGYTSLTYTDITKLKEQEDALRKSEQRFRGAIESMQGGFALFDAEDRLVMVNDIYRQSRHGVQEALDRGISFEELVRLNVEMGMVPEAPGREEAYIQKRLEGHHNPAGPVISQFGDEKWNIVQEVRTPEGGIALSFIDITQLKNAELSLRENEERFRSAFENVAVGNIVISIEGIIEVFNSAAGDIFGYKAKEVVGKNIKMLMPEPDRGRHDGYIKNYFETGDAKIIGKDREVTGLRKNGKEFPMHLGVGEMRMGGKISFIGSISDLTETRALEHQLAESQRMQALGQLTGGVAHDFNNLLGIIIGHLDLVQHSGIEDEETLKDLSEAQKAAMRGAKLTQRMLNFSRTSHKTVRSVNVNWVIESIREMLEKSLTSEITFRLNSTPDLWGTEIDVADMENAILNLCLNAKDAMPDGGLLEISTENKTLERSSPVTAPRLSPGEYVLITISDTGKGMPKKIQKQIFSPFFTTKEAGSGLGLSMVYGFIERSRGHISVVSEAGRGTTFSIHLPRASGEVQGRETDAEDKVPMTGGSETILVVDDEIKLLRSTTKSLESLGYSIHHAKNAADALKTLKENRNIDLLFTDIVMPGKMNGMELAKIAHQINPDLKILVTSGFDQGAIKNTRNFDFSKNLLSKPYRLTDLSARIRAMLDAGK